MEITQRMPDKIQVFDYYVDREYYKVGQGIFFRHDTLLLKERIKEENRWEIYCKVMPDKITVNGEEYKLVKN